MREIEFLTYSREVKKIYGSFISSVLDKYKISATESEIIIFLNFSEDLDTASDIVEYTRIPKANISMALDSLNKRGLVESMRDESDKRKVHIRLCENAHEIVADMLEVRSKFSKMVFEGFSDEEYETFFRLNNKIRDNIAEFIKNN